MEINTNSIVDFLASEGQNFKKPNRACLFEQCWLGRKEDFSGQPAQNTALLKALKERNEGDRAQIYQATRQLLEGGTQSTTARTKVAQTASSSQPIWEPTPKPVIEKAPSAKGLAQLNQVTPGKPWAEHAAYTKGYLTRFKHNALPFESPTPETIDPVEVQAKIERLIALAQTYTNQPSRYQMHASGKPDATGHMSSSTIVTDCAYFQRNLGVESGILPPEALNTHYFSRDFHKSTLQVASNEGRRGDYMFWMQEGHRGGNLVTHIALIVGHNPDGSYKVIDASESQNGIHLKPVVQAGLQGKYNIVIGRMPGMNIDASKLYMAAREPTATKS